MTKKLIVFCPGYSGLPSAKYNMLLKRFANDGYTTLSINYKFFGRGDITETANRVQRVIQSLRGQFDHITLLGHSMGGLVARKALELSPGVADSLVTIGSPHKGVQAAISPFWWLGGHSVGQMQPDSKFLKYLEDPQVPTLALSGEWDFIVKDAALPENTSLVKNIEIPYGEHTLMLFSPRVYGEIYSWLTYEVLDELG